MAATILAAAGHAMGSRLSRTKTCMPLLGSDCPYVTANDWIIQEDKLTEALGNGVKM